jgi:hypothetical protein
VVAEVRVMVAHVAAAASAAAGAEAADLAAAFGELCRVAETGQVARLEPAAVPRLARAKERVAALEHERRRPASGPRVRSGSANVSLTCTPGASSGSGPNRPAGSEVRSSSRKGPAAP